MLPSYVCFILTSRHVAEFLFLMLPMLARITAIKTTDPCTESNRACTSSEIAKSRRGILPKANEAQRELCIEKFSSQGMDNGVAKPGFLDDNQSKFKSVMIQITKVLCCGLGLHQGCNTLHGTDCHIFNPPANNRKVCNVFATEPTTDFLYAYAEL